VRSVESDPFVAAVVAPFPESRFLYGPVEGESRIAAMQKLIHEVEQAMMKMGKDKQGCGKNEVERKETKKEAKE